MKGRYLILALLLVLSISTAAIIAIKPTNIKIPSYAKVKTIGLKVYWDDLGTDEIISIDWGTLEPNSSKTINIYIDCLGNTDVTLSLTTNSWIPPHTLIYITLSWDYMGQTISPDGLLLVHLTISVDDSVRDSEPLIEDFSFEIIMYAHEIIV